MEESFWQDANHAQSIIRQLNAMKEIVETFDRLHQELDSLKESYELLKEEDDGELFPLVEMDYLAFDEQIADFEIKVLLSHEYVFASNTAS